MPQQTQSQTYANTPQNQQTNTVADKKLWMRWKNHLFVNYA